MVNDVRLSQIDETNRKDHYHLTADDRCYYLYEYTSHRDYSFSATNNLISNLKKKPSQADLSHYRYRGSKPEPPKIPSADQRGLSRARSMG
ncbi:MULTISPECIES: hypothetical protein [Acetobacter]|uniref:hypothetical protein n=1 Tax=Acetobacter TaxID=434 RepID=UPI0037706D7D